MRYHIWTVGCQMNKSDSERMANALESVGYVPSDAEEGASVIVLNSCSVRASAEDRVVGKLGLLRRLKRVKPELMLVLAGCMVGEDASSLRKRLPYVDAFIRPGDCDALLEAVARHLGGDSSCLPIGRLSVADTGEVCRWVPIIFGCNNFCTYCIVPYRRGRERSRPVEEIVAESRQLASLGAREITLLGQNVDSYGHDLPDTPSLAALLRRLSDVDSLQRVRFLTSHPKDMSDELIDTVARLPKVCEHINLPVQHGDDEILRRMGRGYVVAQYLSLVDRLRAAIPEVSLSTDVIVGFPGETEAQFLNTFELIKGVGFDAVHAAMYSPREGTAAAKWDDDVPGEEKKRRLAMIEQYQEARLLGENEKLIGSTVEILVERWHKGKWQGRTRSNKLVFFPSTEIQTGRMVNVRVDGATAWSLQASLLDDGAAASTALLEGCAKTC